jgi:hypothetical protein
VHEVELVLRVVVVRGADVVRRVDDAVDAEGVHSERRADLAKAGALAEIVERTDLVAHGATLRLSHVVGSPVNTG